MKKIGLIVLVSVFTLFSQQFQVDTAFIRNNFPKEIVYQLDITYKTVDSIALKFDYYRLDLKKTSYPVVISIHGGAWLAGSKNDDIRYSTSLFKRLLAQGYAICCIDYRLSQAAVFPAQIQDCNDALNYICSHSKELLIDKNSIAVMGGSAGGHLVQLLGTSNSHTIPGFYSDGKKGEANVKAVIAFYGVSDFIACRGNSGFVNHDDPNAAEAKLLGAPPLERPDLARIASPTTYVDKNCPPFLLFHGDKDPVVQYSQSVLLHSYLNLAGVPNKFITVKGAGHGGAEFNNIEYENEIMNFLKTYIGL